MAAKGDGAAYWRLEGSAPDSRIPMLRKREAERERFGALMCPPKGLFSM